MQSKTNGFLIVRPGNEQYEGEKTFTVSLGNEYDTFNGAFVLEDLENFNKELTALIEKEKANEERK